jgi:serine/threonine-protein kinase
MIGSTISHYRIVERLGRGAMGLVYKAQDTRLDRPVALKVISREIAAIPEQRARFIREARTASLLDHPNICTIHDFGETTDGDLFIVMTYLPGENLRLCLERGPLPLKQAINIARQVACGLAKAHSLGVVHRDIKPANVMLLPDGVAKIVDFGLAKLPNDVGLTNTGGVVGTVPYMSPEQLRGDPLDGRTDVWSWGVTFYEMLAGDRPFESKTEATIMRAIMELEAPSVRSRRTDLPEGIEQIITQAMRKRREERPSAAELVDALEGVAVPSRTTTQFTLLPRPLASVAVLPFRNLSSDTDNEYLVDGLTEELIHALSRLPGLQVVSRTSAFEFKGKDQNLRNIGEQLKVASIVEGSVRKIGDRIRVNTQLSNVSDGMVLWSERFDCAMTDIFDVQDNMARAIADHLKIELGSKSGTPLVRRYNESIEAYDLYLRGRFQANKRTPEGFQKAYEYFQQALELQPNYPPALAGVADYHVAVASWGMQPPNEAWPPAKEAVRRALDADDTLAEAHASMGLIQMWYEWNWKEAEREFLRAIELSPALPVPHVNYNLLLVQNGRSNEAEEQIRTALACDPLSVPANVYLAGVYHYRRDYEHSLKQTRRALDLNPDDIEAHIVMALNYEQQKNYPDAVAELEKAYALSGEFPLILAPLASCYGGWGNKEKALELLEQLNAAATQMYVAPISWVMIYLGIGDVEQAFEWLEKAAEARDALLCYLKVGPIYDSIRDDPRYEDLLYRIGLADDSSVSDQTITSHRKQVVES